MNADGSESSACQLDEGGAPPDLVTRRPVRRVHDPHDQFVIAIVDVATHAQVGSLSQQRSELNYPAWQNP